MGWKPYIAMSVSTLTIFGIACFPLEVARKWYWFCSLRGILLGFFSPYWMLVFNALNTREAGLVQSSLFRGVTSFDLIIDESSPPINCLSVIVVS